MLLKGRQVHLRWTEHWTRSQSWRGGPSWVTQFTVPGRLSGGTVSKQDRPHLVWAAAEDSDESSSQQLPRGYSNLLQESGVGMGLFFLVSRICH